MYYIHIIKNKKEDDTMLFSIKCKCGENAHWDKDLSVYSCEDCGEKVDIFSDKE